ncbi:hypothetical protein L2E82_25123 [Cichorium intybus]|uniref:Uncharacterized protein n=1 Tax=Cichorium intybus TaxID=13427 RepID=A0ACB9E3C5_CICIN|nr:hypothetical protein L2E82_25123 [Cichorium intybus]
MCRTLVMIGRVFWSTIPAEFMRIEVWNRINSLELEVFKQLMTNGCSVSKDKKHPELNAASIQFADVIKRQYQISRESAIDKNGAIAESSEDEIKDDEFIGEFVRNQRSQISCLLCMEKPLRNPLQKEEERILLEQTEAQRLKLQQLLEPGAKKKVDEEKLREQLIKGSDEDTTHIFSNSPDQNVMGSDRSISVSIKPSHVIHKTSILTSKPTQSQEDSSASIPHQQQSSSTDLRLQELEEKINLVFSKLSKPTPTPAKYVTEVQFQDALQYVLAKETEMDKAI